MIRPPAARHTRRAARGALLALGALLSAGCPGSTEVETEYFDNYKLTVVRGDNETQPVGTPITVTVHLTDPGNLQWPNVSDAYVSWTATSGGGNVAPVPRSATDLRSDTDQNGQASAVWTLGAQAGEQRLTATVSERNPSSINGPGKSKSITVRATALSNAVDRITVTPDASITVGATVPISYSLFNGRNEVLSGRNVNVFSSNATILRVDVGPGGTTATGLAPGTADVIVQSEGKEGRARITITVAPVATIGLAPADTILTQGRTAQLRVTLRDAAGNLLTGRTVTYESLDPGIASVSPTGLVTALAPGVAGIAARSEGREARVVLGVLPSVATLTLSPNQVTLTVGGVASFVPTVRDAQGNTLSGRRVEYATGNAAVATIDTNGVVLGRAIGEATITATSEGRTATARVIVTAGACPATGVCTVVISTSGDRTSLQVGHTLLFQTILRNAAGTQITSGATVTYTNSNPAVARLDPPPAGGPAGYFRNIVGVAPGTTTITATADGRSTSVVISVTP